MKIAICLSGQLRTAPRSLPSLKRFIGECDVDVFMHTWDINSKTPKFQEAGPHSEPYVPITNIELAESISIINPKTVEVQDYQLFFNNLCTINSQKIMLFPLFYTWLRSVRLMREYEKYNNIKYDIVIKSRPDLIYHPTLTLQNIVDSLPDNKYFISNYRWFEPNGKPTIDDIFFISNSDNMYEISRSWWKKSYLFDVVTDISMHVQFYDLIDRKNIPIYGFNDIEKLTCERPFSINRPECRYNIFDEFDKCFEYDRIHYWGYKQ